MRRGRLARRRRRRRRRRPAAALHHKTGGGAHISPYLAISRHMSPDLAISQAAELRRVVERAGEEYLACAVAYAHAAPPPWTLLGALPREPPIRP